MKVYLGSDHRGFALKEKVFAYLAKSGYAVEDVGGRELNPDDDFPQFAAAAALRVIGDDSDGDPRAILICGGGQGMCMAANAERTEERRVGKECRSRWSPYH